MPPEEETNLSEKERAVVQQIADVWGISFEEAADRLSREGMAARFKAGTGRAPAKVYQLPRKK